MASPVGILNMALGHLGIQQTVMSFEERSAEAIAGRRFFNTVKNMVLVAARWPHSRRFMTLQLVENDPTSEWKYSYRYSNDSLLVRRIFSGLRNDTESSQIPYVIGADNKGLLLYCDLDAAEMEYTDKCESLAFFPDDFSMAFSLLLAVYMAPSLTKGDSAKLRSAAMELYQQAIADAISNRLGEENPGPQPLDSFTRSRM